MTRRPPPDTEYAVEDIPQDDTHWRNGFDSRFLRVYWLAGKPRVVTITNVQNLQSRSKEGTKKQRLITLAEAPKPWATNVTNCETIAQLYGDDPHAWIGKRIEIFPTKTQFGRETVDCIRVKPRVPPEPSRNRAKPAAGLPAGDRHPLPDNVTAILGKLAASNDEQSLIDALEGIVSDDSLSPEHTALLQRAVDKRRGQLGLTEVV